MGYSRVSMGWTTPRLGSLKLRLGAPKVGLRPPKLGLGTLNLRLRASKPSMGSLEPMLRYLLPRDAVVRPGAVPPPLVNPPLLLGEGSAIAKPSGAQAEKARGHLRNPAPFTFLRYSVGARGFEPPTPRSRTECATRLRYAPSRRITVTPKESARGGPALMAVRRAFVNGLLEKYAAELAVAPPP